MSGFTNADGSLRCTLCGKEPCVCGVTPTDRVREARDLVWSAINAWNNPLLATIEAHNKVEAALNVYEQALRAECGADTARVEAERDEAIKTLNMWDRGEVLRDIAWCVERACQLFHNRELGMWRLAYFPGGEEMWAATERGEQTPQDPKFLDVPESALAGLSRPDVAVALVRIAREGPKPAEASRD